MKKIIIVLMSLLILVACSDDKSSNDPKYTDQELLDMGWDYYSNRDYENAIEQFEQLIDRDALLPEANCGLGWVYSRTGELNTAIEKLDLALTQSPSDQIKNDILAGKAIAFDALDLHQDCLDASDQISDNWIFSHNSYINSDDITLLKAISYYALGLFAESLLEVQEIEPGFDADITTVDGRTELAEKIEMLLG